MHARAVDRQTAFAAKCVVYGQLDDPAGREHMDDQVGQHPGHCVQLPGRVAEKAMVAAVMPAVCRTTGPDLIGHEASAVRQDPACHQTDKDLVRWGCKDTLKGP